MWSFSIIISGISGIIGTIILIGNSIHFSSENVLIELARMHGGFEEERVRKMVQHYYDSCFGFFYLAISYFLIIFREIVKNLDDLLKAEGLGFAIIVFLVGMLGIYFPFLRDWLVEREVRRQRRLYNYFFNRQTSGRGSEPSQN